MKSIDVLIVDDEIGIRNLLSEILQEEGYSVVVAENAEQAREIRFNQRPSMVLLDIWMPDCDGLTLLKEWAKNGLLDMPVVMMSGHASIETAIEATKVGALDFLEKPITFQKLLETVKKAMKHSYMQASSIFTINKLGKHEVIQNLNKKLQDAFKSKGSVLLLGETGSPFELVAKYFQKNYDSWFNLELKDRKKRLFDLKSLISDIKNGVLFLGDIIHYSYEEQEQLLELIQQRDQYNFRVISACSIALEKLYANNEFSAKFLNEISRIIINIPPLRDHLSDILFIINNILIELVETKQVKMVRFSSVAINLLSQYNWPGNFEQLKHAVKSLARRTDGGIIDDVMVSEFLEQYKMNTGIKQNEFNFDLPLRELRESVEKSYFEYHMMQENANMSKVSKKVGLERTHLYRKLKQLGINYSKKNNQNNINEK